MGDKFPYEDIINLSPHISKKYPQASRSDRAARFSPFAAITGYEDMVIEAARVTEEKIELEESARRDLDEKLNMVMEHLQEKKIVEITYFMQDTMKSGGAYVTTIGSVKRMDEYHRLLLMEDGKDVRIDDIFNIEILA